MFNRASCLTRQTLCGCGSCFSMKAWVNIVWLMRSRDITSCFLLDALKSWSPYSQGGLNLEEFYYWCSCPIVLVIFWWGNLLIIGFKSVYGMEIALGLRSKADLAAESALSFPLTPMWLGIQHKIISLWLDIESSLLSNLTINGFSSFLFSTDVFTESESENMINLLCFVPRNDIESKVNSTSIGRTFLWIILFRTAAHAVLLWSFEPSVKTCKCSG